MKATSFIEAKTIGNEMGTTTVVGVGVNPTMKKRMDELKNSLSTKGNNKIQLTQLMTALRKNRIWKVRWIRISRRCFLKQ